MRNTKFFMALAICGFVAIGSPTRSSIGARSFMQAEMENAVYTASDYVQEGLIAHWDGIENIGYGQHDNNATYWVDLTGGGADWAIGTANGSQNAFEIGDYYIKILSGVSYSGNGHCTPSWNEQDVLTVEYVIDQREFVLVDRVMVCGFSIGNGPRWPQFWVSPQHGDNACFSAWNSVPRIDFDSHIAYLSVCKSESLVLCNGTFIESRTANGDMGYPYMCPTISGYSAGVATGIKLCAIRLYSRLLSDSERMTNYKIDKARFGL